VPKGGSNVVCGGAGPDAACRMCPPASLHLLSVHRSSAQVGPCGGKRSVSVANLGQLTSLTYLTVASLVGVGRGQAGH
jgi:hypothetical protein